MKNFNPIFVFGFLCLVLISSCKDEPEPPEIPNEEEVITTLTYTLVQSLAGDTVVFRFQDLDGDGGMDAIVEEGILSANTIYTGSLELLNELESPAEDITEEVEEEGEEHQFFFLGTDSDLVIAYNDEDAGGDPIGISSIVTTNDANVNSLTIVLRHEPAKDEDGVSGGDITNAGGETDIEVTFNVVIE